MLKQLLILLLFNSVFNLVYANNDPIVVAGNARFTVISSVCIRIEYAENKNFVDERTLFAENRDNTFSDFELINNKNEVIINTGRIKIIYKPDGNIFSKNNLSAFIKSDTGFINWYPGKKNEKNLGGTLPTLDGVDHAVKVNDGLLSMDGWYLIDDSNLKILKNDWISERNYNSKVDWYLFGYGISYKEALQSLTAISGKVPLIRKYVLGSWYCRWHDYTSYEFAQLVKEYKDHDFPLDILVMDMGWHKMDATYGYGHANMLGWTGFSWNKNLIPEPESLLKRLKNDHIYVSLNVHPHDGIRNHEDMYADFMRALGKDPTKNENLPFNAGDKNYMDAYFKYAHQPHEKIGVDFWWVDWQQDHIYPYVFGYPYLKHLPWLNYLYFKNSEQDNKRGLGFSRWGGWGDQKRPIHFSGDIMSSWETLKFEVSFTVNSGNTGCFFWAHDLGGFYGERNPEQYARWVQFGITNASLRIHSCGDNLDRRPWLWGDEAEKSMKISFHLRSRLMPYIYSSVWQSSNQSIPLLRPLYLEYPKQEDAYTNAQEYFFGDNILAAPIVTPGSGKNKIAKQRVWFPDGSWYNIFSNKKYEGNRTDSVEADLYEFPLFVRGGAPIPMQNYTQRMTSEPISNLIIRCYPGRNGEESTYTLYEDDGFTKDYLKNKYAVTVLKYKREGNKSIITINGTTGEYNGQIKTRTYDIVLAATKKASNASVNKNKVSVDYHSESLENIIHIPTSDITKGYVIEISVKDN